MAANSTFLGHDPADREGGAATMRMTRREALGAGALAAALGGRAWGQGQAPRRKRMAIVTTEFRLQSHGQHMGDRFLVGYPMEGRWHRPGLDVVSLYVDQKPAGDLSQQ